MNLIPGFLRHKRKMLEIDCPANRVRVCEQCQESFNETLVEGNLFPVGCPACGHVLKEMGNTPFPPSGLKLRFWKE